MRLFFLDLICDLAAVTVYTESHIVDKTLFHTFDINSRKIGKIRIDKDFLTGLFFDIFEKIISGAAAFEINIVFYLFGVDSIYEIVKCTVSAYQNHFIFRSKAFKIFGVIETYGVYKLCLRSHIRPDTVVCQRIVKIVFHFLFLLDLYQSQYYQEFSDTVSKHYQEMGLERAVFMKPDKEQG